MVADGYQNQFKVYCQTDCAFASAAKEWADTVGAGCLEFKTLDWYQSSVNPSTPGIAILSTRQVDCTIRKFLGFIQDATPHTVPIVMFGPEELEMLCNLALEFQFIPAPKNCSGQSAWDTLAIARAQAEKKANAWATEQSLRETLKGLSAEEETLLKLWMRGCPNKQIAAELDVCLRTVQLRKQVILTKLSAENVNEIIIRVSQLGLNDLMPAFS